MFLLIFKRPKYLSVWSVWTATIFQCKSKMVHIFITFKVLLRWAKVKQVCKTLEYIITGTDRARSKCVWVEVVLRGDLFEHNVRKGHYWTIRCSSKPQIDLLRGFFIEFLSGFPYSFTKCYLKKVITVNIPLLDIS